jgi:hypothetical protein
MLYTLLKQAENSWDVANEVQTNSLSCVQVSINLGRRAFHRWKLGLGQSACYLVKWWLRMPAHCLSTDSCAYCDHPPRLHRIIFLSERGRDVYSVV